MQDPESKRDATHVLKKYATVDWLFPVVADTQPISTSVNEAAGKKPLPLIRATEKQRLQI